MGLGKLNIWVRYEPDVTWSCKVDAENQWYVTVKDCSNRILVWGGKIYRRIPTVHGHVEIDVPPGCYILSAISKATGSNTFTAPAMAIVDCGETVCVNLLAPIIHVCSWYWIIGVQQAVEDKAVPPGVADRAIAATNEVLKYVKIPQLRPGEIPIEREIEETKAFLDKRKVSLEKPMEQAKAQEEK